MTSCIPIYEKVASDLSEGCKKGEVLELLALAYYEISIKQEMQKEDGEKTDYLPLAESYALQAQSLYAASSCYKESCSINATRGFIELLRDPKAAVELMEQAVRCSKEGGWDDIIESVRTEVNRVKKG